MNLRGVNLTVHDTAHALLFPFFWRKHKKRVNLSKSKPQGGLFFPLKTRGISKTLILSRGQFCFSRKKHALHRMIERALLPFFYTIRSDVSNPGRFFFKIHYLTLVCEQAGEAAAPELLRWSKPPPV